MNAPTTREHRNIDEYLGKRSNPGAMSLQRAPRSSGGMVRTSWW